MGSPPNPISVPQSRNIHTCCSMDIHFLASRSLPHSSMASSMSSASSSGASLAPKTSSSSPRSRPRRRSPPSMYVAYETSTAKAPKPLIKLDKKPKAKAASNPYTSSSSPPNSELPQRRPSVSSFLGLRRNTVSVSPPIPRNPRTLSPRNDFAAPPLRGPAHEDLPPTPQGSGKAARMLGDPFATQPIEDDRGVIFSHFSGKVNGDTFSLGTCSSIAESVEDDAYTDDSHIQRESRAFTPIEFAPTLRPRSTTPVPPPPASDIASEADDEWVELITPVSPSSPPCTRTVSHPHRQYTRTESYDHYSNQRSREYMHSRPDAARPDTPFVDTSVAVTSQVVGTRGKRHPQEPSVVRTEPSVGWIGEWNQEDMQDVIHKLRSLK
ncbi:hypothetical protein B0H13DRAFT_2518251 [Mycena leptocephala]|nr:hypothetical protein B0H13DRAFT_2518251 [Mycena leptocephala]